jgi:hypothetical protein
MIPNNMPTDYLLQEQAHNHPRFRAELSKQLPRTLHVSRYGVHNRQHSKKGRNAGYLEARRDVVSDEVQCLDKQ